MEEQTLITDLFERVTLYDLKVAEATAVRRTDGKWDVTVPIEAKKLYVEGNGAETETPLAERIEVGLFTAEPGRDAFDKSHVILMERHPVRSGRQVLRFVIDKKPTYAGVDPTISTSIGTQRITCCRWGNEVRRSLEFVTAYTSRTNRSRLRCRAQRHEKRDTAYRSIALRVAPPGIEPGLS